MGSRRTSSNLPCRPAAPRRHHPRPPPRKMNRLRPRSCLPGPRPCHRPPPPPSSHPHPRRRHRPPGRSEPSTRGVPSRPRPCRPLALPCGATPSSSPLSWPAPCSGWERWRGSAGRRWIHPPRQRPLLPWPRWNLPPRDDRDRFDHHDPPSHPDDHRAPAGDHDYDALPSGARGLGPPLDHHHLVNHHHDRAHHDHHVDDDHHPAGQHDHHHPAAGPMGASRV